MANASTPPAPRTRADTIVTRIDWLLTVDGRRRVIRDAAVAVRDGRFVAVGKTDDVLREWSAERTVDASGCVATPGLIDNHLHSSFQMARGLADEANAQAFLFDHMYPFEGANTAEDVFVSASLAAVEMLRHGVTCYVDPGNYFPDATVRAVAATGMRMVVARSTFDRNKSAMGHLPPSMIEDTAKCLAETEAVLEQYRSAHGGRVTASASFRGVNNSSDALITGLKALAEKHGTFLQTHACFSYQTHDASVAQFGRPEIERLESLGVLDEKTLLVHSGWLEPHELAILAKRKPTLVAAPTSSGHNGYGAVAQGKLPELMALGVNVSLGTDHACSGTVDMVQEMRACVCGYKEARMNPRVMPPEHAVEMATINGARGAGLADRIGSVEIGKEADLVLFDATVPEWQPLFNPVSNLVYSATGNTVKHVFVAGEQLVRDGRLTRIDEADVMRAVRDTARRIAGRLDMRRIVKLTWPVE